MAKSKKKLSRAKKIKQQRHIEAENYAASKGMSVQSAKEELATKRSLTSKLYSAGLKAFRNERKEKAERIHKLSKINTAGANLVSGGAPGLGKRK
jgi:hypothetical protein